MTKGHHHVVYSSYDRPLCFKLRDSSSQSRISNDNVEDSFLMKESNRGSQLSMIHETLSSMSKHKSPNVLKEHSYKQKNQFQMVYQSDGN